MRLSPPPKGRSARPASVAGRFFGCSKLEIATMEMEKSLNLTAADRKELQQRLTLLEFNAGPANGVFGDKTRSAVADWQKRHS